MCLCFGFLATVTGFKFGTCENTEKVLVILKGNCCEIEDLIAGSDTGKLCVLR